MSFRGRGADIGGNPNKMELGPDRKFGGPDADKPGRDDVDRFDSRGRGGSRGGPFGRGGRPSPGRDRFNDRPRDYGFGRDESMGRDRSPLRPSDRYMDRYRKDDDFGKRDDHVRKDSGRPFYDDPGRDRFMDSRSRHDGNFNSRFDGPPGMPHKGRPMNYPAPPSKSGYYDGFPKPNECEIIVVKKEQRAYAESVEYRVKNLGVLVDMLFLKDEALLTQTIDDIARKGSLYAMVVSPQNETHTSVTVNILHGTPQEHRNMPLDDALKLLSRNFHDYIRSQRDYMERERGERGPYIGVVSADREMQFLLRMLADGRWVSMTELNIIIRYLCERRDKMQSEDRGPSRMPIPPAEIKTEPPFKPKDEIGVSQKEQDLQNRIMNLMSQGAPKSEPESTGRNPALDIPPRQSQPSMSPNMPPMMGAAIKSERPDSHQGSLGLDSNLPPKDVMNKPVYSSVPSSTPLSDTASTFINFDNPSVQKALDNLIQSGPSLLKNISLSTSGVANTPPNPTSGAGGNSAVPSSNQHMQYGGMGTQRGPDISGNQQRNPAGLGMPQGGGMGDMGGPRSGSSLPGLGGIGPGSGGMGPGSGSMGPGSGGMGPGSGGMGPGSGGMGPGSGSMGPGSGGMGPGSGRGGYNTMPPDMGPRGFGNAGMQDMGRMGPPRNNMSGPPRDGMGVSPRDAIGGLRDNMGGPPREGMGGPPRDGMGGPPRDGMGGPPRDSMGAQPRGGMGPPGQSGGQDLGPPQGMGPGGNFQNQYNKYPGPNQQGNFQGSFNSAPGMGGMSRPSYGGPPGMGGMGAGLRRY